MEPPTEQTPRGTKRPLGGGDVDKASGARRYGNGAAAYEFVDDDGEGGGGVSSRDGTGFLDESGTFVERAARGGTKEDAWLGTADADAAPAAAAAATKRARKALRKQEEDERLVDDLVAPRAVFEIKKRMAGLLEPGETVPRALRRLKGLKGGGARGAAGRMDEAARRAFDELTDAAAELVERGDLDAYSDDREAFERAAWVYEYRRRARASASAAASPEVEKEHGADRTAAATSRSYVVDMFGDDDVDDGAKSATDVDAGGQAVNPDQLAATEEAGEGTGVEGSDYVFDSASGYYYSSSTGYFYDAASGCYCSASTGTWFSYGDHDGQCSGTGR